MARRFQAAVMVIVALTTILSMPVPAPIIAQKSDPPPGPVTPPTITLIIKGPGYDKASKTVKSGSTFYIIPKTNCTAVNWDIPDGLTVDDEISLKDKLAVALSGTLPSGQTSVTYTIIAYGALGDQAALAKIPVTIGAAPPGPTPPPAPDALTQALQAAYNSDTDATKATLIKTLATLYTTGASTTVNDPSLNTLQDLLGVMSSAGTSLVGDPTKVLVNTRKAIGTYLSQQLGTDLTVSLSTAERSKCQTTFAAVAAALGNVK